MDFASIQHAFSAIPLDWVIVAGMTVLFVFDGLRAGTARIAALALALPLAQIIIGLIPRTAFIADLSKSFSSGPALAVIFALILVLLFIFMYRITDTVVSDSGPMQALLSGLAASIMLVVVWQAEPALSGLWSLSPALQHVFGETYRLFWVLAAYGALAMARG